MIAKTIQGLSSNSPEQTSASCSSAADAAKQRFWSHNATQLKSFYKILIDVNELAKPEQHPSTYISDSALITATRHVHHFYQQQAELCDWEPLVSLLKDSSFIEPPTIKSKTKSSHDSNSCLLC
ncbi:hypothetical protein QOT17_020016 [Balamuthia mandrillaris]